MTLFISYSSRDGDAVRTFVQHLEQAGHRVWLDQDLHGGDAWWAAILRQIRDCEIFIVALSQNSLDSQPCQAEIAYAKALGLPILPIQIGEVDGYRLDPIFNVQAVDYRNPTVTTGFALTNALAECARLRKPLPDPLPDAPPIPYEYLHRLAQTIRGPAPIPHGDQVGLLQQLSQAWRDESDEHVRADIRSLMRTLRNRPEATHATVSAIDQALSEQARPAGWFPDPSGVPGGQRYWDGAQWTRHTAGGASAAAPQSFVTPAGSTGSPLPPAAGMSGGPVGSTNFPPWEVPPDSGLGPQSDSKVMSIAAFVLGGLALLIPIIGIGGVVCGFIALSRKEKLAVPALAVSIAMTVLSFLLWFVIYTS